MIEVTGRTQKGARVLVNGGEMPMVNSDGQFPLFHAAVAAGRSRDFGHGAAAQGGVKYAAKKIVIQWGSANEEASPTRDDCGRNTAWGRRLAASLGGVKAPASG